MAVHKATSKPLLSDYEALDDTDSSPLLDRKDDARGSVGDWEEHGLERSEGLLVKEGVLRRLLMAVVKRRKGRAGGLGERQRLDVKDKSYVKISFLREASFCGRSVRLVLVGGLFVLTFLSILLTIFLSPYPPTYLPPPSPSPPTNPLPPASLLTLTTNTTPLPCHSHNDYWRPSPLYSALRIGCTGVEADVWLFSNKLYVGHTARSLRREKTLQAMYIDPLVHLLDLQNPNPSSVPKNGVFTTAPTHPVILLIDFKPSPGSSPATVFSAVSAALAPLRRKNYLTYYNGTTLIPGPITAVATGSAPFDLVLSDHTHRDIFFDAPLAALSSQSPPAFSVKENAYYASTSFRAQIGTAWFFRLSAAQRAKVRAQVDEAHKRGLKARYWSTPGWPRGLRDSVWRVLREEGVDVLNGDDLSGLRAVLEEEEEGGGLGRE